MAEVVNYPVVYLHPSKLKPYYRNNKRHSKKQILLMAKAIKTVGFDQPIVVDKDYVIIKGHGRRLAALELSMDLVPVVVREDLSPAEVMASRIVDNKTHSMSEVDKGREQSEIAKYVNLGGSDEKTFFDFMSTKPPAMTQVATGVVTPHKAAAVAGTLTTCPKCNNTFMEVKK